MSEAKGHVKCFFCGKAGDLKTIKFAQHLNHRTEKGDLIRLKISVDLEDSKGIYQGNQKFCSGCVERLVIEGVSA